MADEGRLKPEVGRQGQLQNSIIVQPPFGQEVLADEAVVGAYLTHTERMVDPERFVVVITSNDGGAGYVCEDLAEVERIIRAEFTDPDSEPFIEGAELAAMERDLASMRSAMQFDPGASCRVAGRSAWKESAYIATLTIKGLNHG